MGERCEPIALKKHWSIELCGGTHVQRTGDIGLIHIVAESSVASGVRRIEALTGTTARLYLRQQDKRIYEIASFLKISPANLEERVRNLFNDRRKFEKELNNTRKNVVLNGKALQGRKGEITTININGISFMGGVLRNIAIRDLKTLVDSGKKQIKSGVVAFVSVSEDGKGSAVVGVTDDLINMLNAVDLVRIVSVVLGGQGGGGRPDMAQAGGSKGDKAEEAITALKAFLKG
ncbi:alanyl-tRNA synthetase [Bartonella sp. AR 15-3]|nr:alanyl-tRNA synthetase [Bartonella sp. AR 15-3]